MLSSQACTVLPLDEQDEWGSDDNLSLFNVKDRDCKNDNDEKKQPEKMYTQTPRAIFMKHPHSKEKH